MAELMPPGYFDEDKQLPPGFDILFPTDSDADRTQITETPPRMVLPLVRMRIINEASNPKRKESLLELFVREFDRRMLSYDRKSRLEAVRMFQGAMMAAESEEEASL